MRLCLTRFRRDLDDPKMHMDFRVLPFHRLHGREATTSKVLVNTEYVLARPEKLNLSIDA
jgi:hypothetical protein